MQIHRTWMDEPQLQLSMHLNNALTHCIRDFIAHNPSLTYAALLYAVQGLEHDIVENERPITRPVTDF